MRLWHSKLIPLLDGKRLCDLHMSCCNLRGKGWGKRNVSINYIYDDPLGEDALTVYHHEVLAEMDVRGYHFDIKWIIPQYCGKNRPERICDPKRYKEARLRNVPLKGHNLNVFLRDVESLRERGLPLAMHCAANSVSAWYEISLEDKSIVYFVGQDPKEE